MLITGSLLSLYACSFKDFSYLDGGGGAAGSTGGTGNGGTSGSGFSGTGGDAGTSGSAAGTAEPTGGTTGAEAGTGGESGDGGSQSEGGEGGVPSGGTAGSGGAAGTGGTLPVGGEGGESGSTAGQGGTSGASGSGGNAGNAGNGGSGGNPPLVGNLLVNPGFQSGLSGWTIDPPTATGSRHVYTQAPNPMNETTSSLATWHQTQEYSVFVSQTITGLEPGNYTFKGFVSTQRTQEAYLFARNYGGEEIKLPIPTVSFEWQEYSIPIAVTGTSCEVGLFVHNGPEDWVNADEFSFEKDP